MSIIENFAELSAEEQKQFAEALVQKINSEGIFTSEGTFKITEVEVYEHTGGLVVALENEGDFNVHRDAFWTCSDESEIYSDPGYDADYPNSIYDDAKKSFKTLSTVIDGYKVSLDIDDIEEGDSTEIEVDNYHDDDDGIGDYEYFGFTGYDSKPYVAVEGTITVPCTLYASLYIEPANDPLA